IAAIFKLFAWPVPVDHEAADSKISGFGDLAFEDGAVLRVVADVDVTGTSKPRLVSGQQHGATLGRAKVGGAQRLMDVGVVATSKRQRGGNHHEQHGVFKRRQTSDGGTAAVTGSHEPTENTD